MDRGELPAEIDGIADAGVHAEPAVRRHHMHRVAGQQHAAAAIVIRHHATPDPVAELDDLEIGMSRPMARRTSAAGSIDFGIGVGLAVDHQPPEILAVGRRQARPRAFRTDDDVAAGLALVVLVPQLAARETSR